MPKVTPRPAAGVPDWMVTYGDLMTLLLCFFVIIVSLSEIKEDEKFQEVMDSIRSAFGYDGSLGKVPITNDTKNALIRQLQQIVIPPHVSHEGDTEEEGIQERNFRVTQIREGIEIVIGGRILFDRFSTTPKPEAVDLLGALASKLVGHNTKINIRGHATKEPIPPEYPYDGPMDLSYARARAVEAVLVNFGIRKARIRVHAIGSREPINAQAYNEERRASNRRVAIIVTESLVDDYKGDIVFDEASEPPNG